jgi:hypothetical protein
MPTVLDRTIDVLSRIQFPEAQECKEELQKIKLMSMSRGGIAALRVSILKDAAIPAGKALAALEGYDVAEDAMALFQLIQQDLIGAQQEENRE